MLFVISRKASLFIGSIAIAYQAAGSTFTPLPGFSAYPIQSGAVAVSSDGSVIAGHAPHLDAFTPEPAVWDAGRQMSALISPPVDDGSYRIAVEMSSDGTVIVGTRTFPDSSPLQQEAYRWTAEQGFASLGMFPGAIRNRSYAADISDAGDVVVGAALAANDEQRAFLWTIESGMASLGTLRTDGTGASSAEAISTDGLVVVGGAGSELGYEPFRWTAEGMVGLGDLPGGLYGGFASSMSDDGSVVAGAAHSEASGASIEAFRWTEATGMQPLGFLRPGDVTSSVIFVSADGSVIFGSGGNAEDARSFVWDQRYGMRDFHHVLEADFGLADALANWDFVFPTDITADGLTIVGNGRNPAGVGQGWVITLDRPLNIPEPTTLGLACVCAATAFWRRKT